MGMSNAFRSHLGDATITHANNIALFAGVPQEDLSNALTEVDPPANARLVQSGDPFDTYLTNGEPISFNNQLPSPALATHIALLVQDQQSGEFKPGWWDTIKDADGNDRTVQVKPGEPTSFGVGTFVARFKGE